MECMGACRGIADVGDLSITAGGRLAPLGTVDHVGGGCFSNLGH